MKLKYNFEIMELDDQIVAVPVGDNADELHAIIKLNITAAKIFRLLEVDTTIDEVVQELSKLYDDSKNDIKAYVEYYVKELEQASLLM